MYFYLSSFFIGLLAGCLYAFLFLAQQRRIVAAQSYQGWKSVIATTGRTILRLGIFALFAYYVLLTKHLYLTIVFGTFFVSMWLLLFVIRKYF
jgi:hypothetical protein